MFNVANYQLLRSNLVPLVPFRKLSCELVSFILFHDFTSWLKKSEIFRLAYTSLQLSLQIFGYAPDYNR